LKRLQTKLRRLKEKLRRLQKVQQTFAIDVKSSLDDLRTFREDSQHEIDNSRKKQNDSQEKRNALQKKRNNSREHIEQKEIQILKELAVLSEKEDIQLSQQKNARQNDLNFALQKRFHLKKNFEFVQKNSRRIYNASERVYRIAYINK
jgi:Rad3-related DNA helicase